MGNSSHGGAARYEHWDMRGGDWVGEFNNANNSYENIDSANILESLRVVNAIVDRYKDSPVVIGLEPGTLWGRLHVYCWYRSMHDKYKNLYAHEFNI